jgi:hypothetical protein
MQVSIPYKNLTHTLKALKVQIIDSIPFMSQYIPTDIQTPGELFIYLKSITTYKSDPKGIELLQSVPTLLDRGGRGDCDCLVILSISSFLFLGFKKINVVLVGNKSFSPTHIYTEIYDMDKGGFIPFDLTNPTYGKERSYKFKQSLKFCL